MPRPKFSLKTLLWVILVVAAFLSGRAWQRAADQKDHQRLLNQAQLLEETSAKSSAMMRDAVKQLMDAQRRIKELEAHGTDITATHAATPE